MGEKTKTLNIEPTDDDLARSFANQIEIAEQSNDRDRAAALGKVRDAWTAGDLSKKTAFLLVWAGVRTDELREWAHANDE